MKSESLQGLHNYIDTFRLQAVLNVCLDSIINLNIQGVYLLKIALWGEGGEGRIRSGVNHGE